MLHDVLNLTPYFIPKNTHQWKTLRRCVLYSTFKSSNGICFGATSYPTTTSNTEAVRMSKMHNGFSWNSKLYLYVFLVVHNSAYMYSIHSAYFKVEQPNNSGIDDILVPIVVRIAVNLWTGEPMDSSQHDLHGVAHPSWCTEHGLPAKLNQRFPPHPF